MYVQCALCAVHTYTSMLRRICLNTSRLLPNAGDGTRLIRIQQRAHNSYDVHVRVRVFNISCGKTTVSGAKRHWFTSVSAHDI